MIYDPGNHYWIVGDDETHVYASEFAAFVSIEDSIHLCPMACGRKCANAHSLA
jgi:hypothetical protein